MTGQVGYSSSIGASYGSSSALEVDSEVTRKIAEEEDKINEILKRKSVSLSLFRPKNTKKKPPEKPQEDNSWKASLHKSKKSWKKGNSTTWKTNKKSLKEQKS
jgi:hypothetical protein